MTMIFKISEDLAHKYKGSGYAIAASLNNRLIDFAYLRDVIPDFSDDESEVEKLIDDKRLGPTVRHMQAIGNVHIGMCSCYEFIEL